MRSFLRDADLKVETGEGDDSGFKAWVKQVRELAFCIEDIIDKWTLHLAQGRNHQGFLRKLCRLIKRVKERQDIAHEIQEIKKSVVEAKEICDRYRSSFPHDAFGIGGGASGSTSRHDPRLASLFVAEEELVGIQLPKEDLVSKLVDKDVISKNKVISVVGMGGLGKTTLVKKVFDDQRVTANFDCRAWITVSQSYKKDELLRDMIMQLHGATRDATAATVEGINAMEEVALINKLRDYLADKRYVVVFDDVWKIDFWDHMKLALPENDKGSRVIFTTRKEDVVPSARESLFCNVFKVEPLPDDKAFELFCKKAFQYEGGHCPSTLVTSSHEIVKKCGGLPLAIVMIGGLLATKKKVVLEWQKLSDGLSSTLANSQQLVNDERLASIARVLSLSYHDLPYYLKICFLYLGMFPDAYPISCKRLMRLWVALGFIRERHGMAPEDVAEQYLTELIHRNLIQVARVERLHVQGKVKECKVHDLLREIIILPRLEELGLHQVSRAKDINLNGICRHLAVHGWIDRVLKGLGNPQVRSMILFDSGKLPESLSSTFFENYNLLRALDFQGAPLECIPWELGNLWHLRYLSLKETNVNSLPNSIGQLCNLETLDLRYCPLHDMPVEINRLLKLRYLLAFYFDYDSEFTIHSHRGVKMHGSMGCLTALQNVKYMEVDEGQELIHELGKLTQLQKLGLKKLRTKDVSGLCAALEKMNYLRTLGVSTASEEEFLDLESEFVPPPHLRALYIYGPIRKLPNWILQLENLEKIRLCWSTLEGEDPLQWLQALPSLNKLLIYQGFEGNRLYFGIGCFAKLKVLGLRCLVGLKKLEIEEGALPLLEELDLGPLPQLEEMPNFHCLGSLKTLVLWDLQTHFALDLLPVDGHYYCKIKHVTDVVFWYRFKGERYYTFKLSDPRLFKHLKGSIRLDELQLQTYL